MGALFCKARVLSLTTVQLILNNHSLWPSISVSLLFSFLHSRHQGNHISSNQMQFADVLYIAYIIMLYILIAICCFQCMSAYINSLDFHYKSFFFFIFILYWSRVEEISPGCSLEGLTLKLKLQYFGHLMWRIDSLEKTLMLGGIGGRRRRGRQRMRWLDGITD